MDLYFITEGRFIRHLDGKVYSKGGFDYSLWRRYLTFFDNVYVVARVVKDYQHTSNKSNLASGDRVSFIDLPYYVGPYEYITNVNKIKRVLKLIFHSGAAYICRVPGQIGILAANMLNKKNIPYAVEVVGDPWDVFAPGGIGNVLRPFLRYFGRGSLKKIVRRSSAALYVTNSKLQLRYPVKKQIFSVGVSDVKINENVIPPKPHCLSVRPQILKIISIGSLEQMYKAPDIALKAIKLLTNDNVLCNLTWLGDGHYKQDMIKLSQDLGISSEVKFVGNVLPNMVYEYLSAADVFILVSRTEGLPRALIEAMSMGLPCVGSDVGGIPELLDKSVLVRKNSVDDLVSVIKQFYNNISFFNSQASRNFQEAKKYYECALNEKRELFYNEIKRISK